MLFYLRVEVWQISKILIIHYAGKNVKKQAFSYIICAGLNWYNSLEE